MAQSIRAKIDNELTRRVGKWFTVREIQEKLNVNPATLKPLIMKYARENVLKRRHVKGTARSVQFSPATSDTKKFQSMLLNVMPYRGVGSETASGRGGSTRSAERSMRSGGSRGGMSSTSRRTGSTSARGRTARKR